MTEPIVFSSPTAVLAMDVGDGEMVARMRATLRVDFSLDAVLGVLAAHGFSSMPEFVCCAPDGPIVRILARGGLSVDVETDDGTIEVVAPPSATTWREETVDQPRLLRLKSEGRTLLEWFPSPSGGTAFKAPIGQEVAERPEVRPGGSLAARRLPSSPVEPIPLVQAPTDTSRSAPPTEAPWSSDDALEDDEPSHVLDAGNVLPGDVDAATADPQSAGQADDTESTRVVVPTERELIEPSSGPSVVVEEPDAGSEDVNRTRVEPIGHLAERVLDESHDHEPETPPGAHKESDGGTAVRGTPTVPSAMITAIPPAVERGTVDLPNSTPHRPSADHGESTDSEGLVAESTFQHEAAPPATDDGAEPDAPRLPGGDHDGLTVVAGALKGLVAEIDADAGAAAGGGISAMPTVEARHCVAGHPNPAEVETCRVCRATVSGAITTIHRPSVARLAFDTGMTVEVDRPQIVGRRPSLPDTSDCRELPALIAVSDPHQDLSRNHLTIDLEGWVVLVTDLGSTNGTTVTHPGQQPVRLRPHDTVAVVDGSRVAMGDVTSFVVEAPSW